MTLLEPEMLMMAVQSGNFPQILFAIGFLKKVGSICARIGWRLGGR